jgi:glutathione S-transferase
VPGDRPVLYSSVRSPHCFKVALVLVEKGIAVDRVEIDLPAREQKTPAYLAINPLGQVPVYVDDLGVHIDSLVILRHLDERHPEPRLFPAEAAALSAVLDWIERSSTTMRDVSHELYWLLIEPPAGGADPAAIERWRATGTAVLDDVEAALARGGGWLVGGALSAADLSCFAWLHGYARFDLPTAWDHHPHVRDWLDRLRARPSFAAAHGAMGRPFASDP